MTADERDEYQRFTDIYDAWIDSSPTALRRRRFYVERLTAAAHGENDVVVELGVGHGGILLEVARRGSAITGVDLSMTMIEECRRRAAAADIRGVEFLCGDFRTFSLPRPARAIAMPYHTIDHLQSDDDKRAALQNLHRNLAPGGRFLFDHFVCDEERARRWHGAPNLRNAVASPRAGHELFLWAVSLTDVDTQTMRIISCTDEVDARGVVVERRYRTLRFGWTLHEQMRALLVASGFFIEGEHGDFDGAPWTSASPEHVWVVTKV